MTRCSSRSNRTHATTRASYVSNIIIEAAPAVTRERVARARPVSRGRPRRDDDARGLDRRLTAAVAAVGSLPPPPAHPAISPDVAAACGPPPLPRQVYAPLPLARRPPAAHVRRRARVGLAPLLLGRLDAPPGTPGFEVEVDCRLSRVVWIGLGRVARARHRHVATARGRARPERRARTTRARRERDGRRTPPPIGIARPPRPPRVSSRRHDDSRLSVCAPTNGGRRRGRRLDADLDGRCSRSIVRAVSPPRLLSTAPAGGNNPHRAGGGLIPTASPA